MDIKPNIENQIVNILKLVETIKVKPKRELTEENIEVFREMLDELVIIAQNDVINETINNVRRITNRVQRNKIGFDV